VNEVRGASQVGSEVLPVSRRLHGAMCPGACVQEPAVHSSLLGASRCDQTKPNEREATSWQIEAEPWPYPTLKKPHHVLRCSREGTRMMAKAKGSRRYGA